VERKVKESYTLLTASVYDCIGNTTSTSDCTTHLVFMLSHILSCIYILIFCLFLVWILRSQILGAKFSNLFVSFVDLFEFSIKSIPFALLCWAVVYFEQSRLPSTKTNMPEIASQVRA
jgi:ABC-type methionine transport system permease subunit